ncbi:MAG TPA: hypothetical protein VIE37_21540 [Methylomirabilota bacterium]|jgi:hypothetical protein
MAARSDRHLDEIYAAPLAEFTRSRDRVAKHLVDAGRQAEANQIKRLRKPSAPLWVVNQLARRDPAMLGRFIEAVDRLKRAHQKGAGQVGHATTDQRAALAALLERAEGIMASAGLTPAPATTQRISTTLLGAAADRQLQRDLRQGRLAEEQAGPGFEVLAGAHLRPLPAAPARAEQPRGRREREAQQRAEQAHRVRQLEQVAARHRRAAAAAASQAEELDRKAQALRQRGDQERTAADEAEREARRLRQETGRPDG